MKIDPLDAHDRLVYLNKTEALNIDECCQDLIKKRPFGNHPFYIFVHPRTEDDGVNKRLIWQDRLTKPVAQTNSMLFKAYPGSDEVKILWIIPPREMWGQYKIGLLTASNVVSESIFSFQNDKEGLEMPEEDDPPPHIIQEIMFEYKPWLFKRDTLPVEKRGIWDEKMKKRENESKASII